MFTNCSYVYKKGIAAMSLDVLVFGIISSPLPEPLLLFNSLREFFASWFPLPYLLRFRQGYITMYRSAAALSFASVVLGQQGKYFSNTAVLGL